MLVLVLMPRWRWWGGWRWVQSRRGRCRGWWGVSRGGGGRCGGCCQGSCCRRRNCRVRRWDRRRRRRRSRVEDSVSRSNGWSNGGWTCPSSGYPRTRVHSWLFDKRIPAHRTRPARLQPRYYAVIMERMMTRQLNRHSGARIRILRRLGLPLRGLG
jgi:hypothetical protein